MPTDQFWARAFLTPIALIFWLPFVGFFFPLTLYFNVAWWQTALGFYLYYQLWGGLVERLARRRLAQRHRRMLVADADIETSSTEELPAPASRLSGLDDYEHFMTRWFGRYDRLIHHVFHLAFLVFMFYPGWWTKALGVLWILGLTKLARRAGPDGAPGDRGGSRGPAREVRGAPPLPDAHAPGMAPPRGRVHGVRREAPRRRAWTSPAAIRSRAASMPSLPRLRSTVKKR
ncbi:hypothetical protein [Nannocystis pusilla]|uniref:hypothetical protein n=1 Tax=Nannocystis pusilla TaxID=889268 RepID=UPI003BF0189A